MLQLVAAELKVDLLHVPIDVIMRHAFGSPVQWVAAVVVAAIGLIGSLPTSPQVNQNATRGAEYCLALPQKRGIAK